MHAEMLGGVVVFTCDLLVQAWGLIAPFLDRLKLLGWDGKRF